MPVVETENGLKYQNPPLDFISTEMSRYLKLFVFFANDLKKYLKGYYKVRMGDYDDIALHDLVIRVNKRNEHSKIFHNIDDSSEFRYAAIVSYWIIKLHPFSLYFERINNDLTDYPQEMLDINDDCINEVFVVYIFLKTLKRVLDVKHISYKFSDRYLEELKYTLRYREVDKNTLITLFEPIMDLDQFLNKDLEVKN